jgi:hypothetical protein
MASDDINASGDNGDSGSEEPPVGAAEDNRYVLQI